MFFIFLLEPANRTARYLAVRTELTVMINVSGLVLSYCSRPTRIISTSNQIVLTDYELGQVLRWCYVFY